MSLTNKKRRFYTAKSCFKSNPKRVAPSEARATWDFESVNRLLRHSLVLLLIIFASLAPVSAMAIDKGEPAPGFTLKNVNGQKVSLEDFKGRPVLLKLGTTWCPTCKEMMATLGEISELLKEKNVVVVDVFVQDSQAMVEKYVAATRPAMNFHALLDDGQAYRGYGVYLIPRLLLIDAEQKVQFDNGGRDVTSAQLVELVKGLPEPQGSGEAAPAKQ